MHIRLRDPELLPALQALLRRAHCVVEKVAPDTLAAAVPEAADERQARLEIDLYLRAWRILHPGAEVEIHAAAERVETPPRERSA
jgi:hypothetical protein